LTGSRIDRTAFPSGEDQTLVSVGGAGLLYCFAID
jgi:hypothetical protein